jgi:two-component system nitrogen regulation sensor histidine kinase NtrY
VNNSLKIPVLLILLMLCFAGTAITIHLTYQKEEILLIDGRKVERNLHKKEGVVKDLLGDSLFFERLRSIGHDTDLKREIVSSLGEEEGIYLYTYSNNELEFWGSEQLVPRSDAGIPEGSSVFSWNNGWYESYKKSSGGFSVVCLIPIKANYPLTNRFLSNEFSDDLIQSANLEIADYDDKAVFNLRNSDGEYLLSLKLRSTNFNTFYSKVGLLMWILAGLTLTILVNIGCLWLSRKGWVKVSVLLFASFLVLFRYFDLKEQWLATNFFSGFFDPRIFASSFVLPSLGALILHVIFATWLASYIYHCRNALNLFGGKPSRFIEYAAFFFSAAVLYLLSDISIYIFESLIVDSSINFDVTNLMNLSIYSWAGLLLLCLVLFTFYLIIESLLSALKVLQIPQRRQLILFLITAGAVSILKLILEDFTLSYFLFICIVFLMGYFSSCNRPFNLAVSVALLFLFAGIASLKQNVFQASKQQRNQLLAIQKLESSEDPNAVMLFLDIERKLMDDKRLATVFQKGDPSDELLVNEEIRKAYFSGYLAKYDFSATPVRNDSSLNRRASLNRFEYFKDKVIAGSRKVTHNFYRLSNNIGYINYFALIPVRVNDEVIGTYVVELRDKSLSRYATYPEILSYGMVDNSMDYEKYSYAYYKNSQLKGQHGSFLYPTTPELSPKNVRQYYQYSDDKGYNHIVFSASQDDLLVLSSELPSRWKQLATLSFLFLVFLSFSILLFSLEWFFKLLTDYDFNFRNLRWSVMILQNRVLYSTRIQAFVVLAVVGTLVIAGIITFFSLIDQYRLQQEKSAVVRISKIARSLETRLSRDPFGLESEGLEQEFNLSAESNAADLNLYDSEGHLIYTTQSKIYDLGLTSRFMNAKAWMNLKDFAREEFFHRERIGDLEFLVAYTPIKNDQNESVAYLSLPYFSNQKDLEDQVGLLLNTIINVYALVLVALGLFAVFVANKITAPLTLVQRSLARTTIGKKNEPIFWKRNDEIGSLIKEYNNMIVALDNSANRIMRSERESAWREMAKQVAHEIKNPLTPLRLGVQLLERAWRENDPRFDEKFERFSKSFIEQIESLNHIASEFSNFAKMPDTKLDDVEIIDVIEKAISIYSENPNIIIRFETSLNSQTLVHGDRDQLLRSFNNLIKNAIEARVHKQKSIVIIAAKYQEPGHIAISVQDSGRGIDEAVQERIFEPNFTTKSSGTGLGLAFVKQTVESMGGTISFKTSRTAGTTFFILLPLKIRN